MHSPLDTMAYLNHLTLPVVPRSKGPPRPSIHCIGGVDSNEGIGHPALTKELSTSGDVVTLETIDLNAVTPAAKGPTPYLSAMKVRTTHL